MKEIVNNAWKVWILRPSYTAFISVSSHSSYPFQYPHHSDEGKVPEDFCNLVRGSHADRGNEKGAGGRVEKQLSLFSRNEWGGNTFWVVCKWDHRNGAPEWAVVLPDYLIYIFKRDYNPIKGQASLELINFRWIACDARVSSWLNINTGDQGQFWFGNPWKPC